MAFCQSERQPLRIATVDVDQRGEDSHAIEPLLPLVETQTRIIFSPATDATTTTGSFVAPTQKTASTPGRSRFSDLGSLHSFGARSILEDDVEDDVLLSATYSEVIEDDGELDSLDSHLPEFRAVPSHVDILRHSKSTPLLPRHDGLGSFHLDHPGASADVQEQLYAFEQFNPRKVTRRRESLELAERELSDEAREVDKMRRIEEWRLEQSKYLLQEIEKETRRRGLTDSILQDRVGYAKNIDMDSKSTDWHEQDDPVGPKKKEVTWTQAIKSVIQEIIGIDDNVLAVLFGETLPDDLDDLSSTPKASEVNAVEVQGSNDSTSRKELGWQDRILARIARELGLLVHRLSDHPGAFSTYVRMQQMPIPYAGLPVIPEASSSEQQGDSEGSVASIQFQPTIRQAAQATQPMNMPSSSRQPSVASDAQTGWENSGATFTQKEWEQDLDVRMVFKYLRSRFTSRAAASSSPPIVSKVTASSHLGLPSTQDTAAKVARVRLHHPLVSRSRPAERRTFKATAPVSPVALRHASSCASQSTRRSARRGSGSSRHYWDIGGSIGTGSIIASTGPMGGWGDV